MPGKLKVVVDGRDDVHSARDVFKRLPHFGDDRRAWRVIIEETIANLFLTRWDISSSNSAVARWADVCCFERPMQSFSDKDEARSHDCKE